MKIEGRVWKFGDHVDTDLIIPARYLNISDPKELAKSCFADVRPEFVREVRTGDIAVAGINFGCGSSREHAPWAMKAAGIAAVIAKSCARIFYRNAFNIGLPVLESEDAPGMLRDGARIAVDILRGEIREADTGRVFLAKPIPEFMMKIIQSGGLVSCIRAMDTHGYGNGV
ncbi:MAG: 3-isopropylmalate dehydratase small subunit [Deltaproteobacteria bacterium]|nr:3-isopropylmalate dehydratase small subunit [Deltaproteobacteria bacterium]